MSSAVSRLSIPTSGPLIVTGWPPSWTTAISVAFLVRADGFSNRRATPRPSSRRGGSARSARLSTSSSSAGLRSSTSRKCLATTDLVEGVRQQCDRLGDLLVGDQQRRGQAQGIGCDGVDHQSPPQGGGGHVGGDGRLEDGGQQEAAAPHLLDPAQP